MFLLLCFWLWLGSWFCSAGALATPPPIVVSVLMPAVEVLEWQPWVQEFNQSHSHIEIQMVEGPAFTDQLESLYTTAYLLGHSPYDIMNIDVSWLPKFAAAGWLLDLGDRLSEGEAEAFLSPDWSGGVFQGHIYRLPSYTGVGLLYYRQDLLTEAGYAPPQTFDQLLAQSQALQTQGKVKWGYLWQGKQYEGLAAMFVEVLTGFGGYWVDPQTLAVGLDSPEAIAAVEFLQQTLTTGVSPPGVTTYAEEDTRYLFQSGQALFLRNWPYVYTLASQPDSPIRHKFGLQGMVHNPQHKSGACQGGWGFGISSQSAHPEEAWTVLQYLTSERVQKEFALATGKIPPRKSLFQNAEILARFPYYAQIYELLEQATLRPPITQYAQASDILQRYLSGALTGQLSSREALGRAARETRQLLDVPVVPSP